MLDNENKRLELILEARRLFFQEKESRTEIIGKLGISFKRLRKYLSGDPQSVAIHGGKGKGSASPLDKFRDVIIDQVNSEVPYNEIYEVLQRNGYKGRKKTLYGYCERMFGIKREYNQPVMRGQHPVPRKAVFEHIWSGKALDVCDKQWIFTLHPELFEIRDAVAGFRLAVDQRNEERLKGWILHFDSTSVPKVKAFAAGLKRDLDSVLNSIRHPESNACLEGNINRLKTIKRDMYGRARYDLLKAKVLRGIIMV